MLGIHVCLLLAGDTDILSKMIQDTTLQALIGKCYPHFTERELEMAEEALVEYAALVHKIYERIRTSPEEYARFKALTQVYKNRRMDKESSQLTLNIDQP